MTIELHQFPTALGVPNLSPFCMRVETWLRLAGLDYKIVWQADPRKGPLGKLPFVRDGERVIADSQNIIEQLTAAHGCDLDVGLTPQQRAVSRAFERLLCEHLYWSLVYCRWMDEATFPVIRKIFFGRMPPVLRNLVPVIAQRSVRAALNGHGLGRHPQAEIVRRGGQDIAALAAQLGEQPYFFGEGPTTLDATAYAFLASVWQIDLATLLKPLVGRHANLVDYCERMRQRCFPR